MSHQTIAASSIVDTHVENWEGENLGVISDVMIHKMHGDVAYLVLSYPGDYGKSWPNKRFAVPFDAFAIKQVPGGVEYILNAQPEFLMQAPGFDTNNWPDFADEKFHSVLKDYYRDISVNVVV